MKCKDYTTNTTLELALMVMLGVFGTGDARKKALGKRYDKVQKLVNQINSTGVIPESTVFSALQLINDELLKEIIT